MDTSSGGRLEGEALVIASGGQRSRQSVKKRADEEESEVSEEEEEGKYEEGDFGKHVQDPLIDVLSCTLYAYS